MELCVSDPRVSAIHTARLSDVANFVTEGEGIRKIQKSKSSHKDSQDSLHSLPYLAAMDSSTEIVSQDSETSPVHFWSSSGALQNGSGWTRCAGKLATSMLVVRLVELGLLPPFDEPIVPFLKLTGDWFPRWRTHPVMKTLTLRQIMAGVGGRAWQGTR